MIAHRRNWLATAQYECAKVLAKISIKMKINYNVEAECEPDECVREEK